MGQVHHVAQRRRLSLPVHAQLQKEPDYSLDQIDLFAAYVIPKDAWYLTPAAVLLGKRRIMTTTLCPLAPPKKKASYRYECYREAWNLLTKSRVELAQWRLGGPPQPVLLAPGVGRSPGRTTESSPALKRWVCIKKYSTSLVGTAETLWKPSANSLSFHVGTENGIDPRLVAGAIFLEPPHDISVYADGKTVLRFWHGEPRALPERLAELEEVMRGQIGRFLSSRGWYSITGSTRRHVRIIFIGVFFTVVMARSLKRRFEIDGLYKTIVSFLNIAPMHDTSQKITDYGLGINLYLFALSRNTGKAHDGQFAP